MAVTAKITGFKLGQEYGVYTSLDATFTITGITSSTIQEGAIAALAALPSYGSEFSGSSNLVCVDRSVDLVSFSNSADKVFTGTAKYIPVGELQDRWTWKFSDGIEQRQKNSDVIGNLLTVTYQYPDDYTLNPQLASAEVTTGATVTASYPVGELVGNCVVSTDTPMVYCDQRRNKVNSDQWGPFPERKCRVSSCVYKTLDVSTSPAKHLVTVVIQINPYGWDTGIAFTDPSSGEVPPDVVDGVGKKSVFLNLALDFNSVWTPPQ